MTGIVSENRGTIIKCTNNEDILANKYAQIGNFGGICSENYGIIEKCINLKK